MLIFNPLRLFLSALIGTSDADTFLDELGEVYRVKVHRRGHFRALVWLFYQILVGIGPLGGMWRRRAFRSVSAIESDGLLQTTGDAESLSEVGRQRARMILVPRVTGMVITCIAGTFLGWSLRGVLRPSEQRPETPTEFLAQKHLLPQSGSTAVRLRPLRTMPRTAGPGTVPGSSVNVIRTTSELVTLLMPVVSGKEGLFRIVVSSLSDGDELFTESHLRAESRAEGWVVPAQLPIGRLEQYKAYLAQLQTEQRDHTFDTVEYFVLETQ